MPETPNTCSRLLTEAAKSILRPMGLIQKGRSRIWLDDQHWWVGKVEFLPSAFSKGSYLNVGCAWLWHPHAYSGYSLCQRIDRYHKFVDEEQFRLAANTLAQQAAEHVLHNRELFNDTSAVRRFYLKENAWGIWPWFDTAIACALSGESDRARHFFSKVADLDVNNYEWVLKAKAEAQQLRAMTFEPDNFRLAINERIKKARELAKLPPLTKAIF